ncbi:hypothetical protein OF83DRAFT_1084959 [Amylostereum chailletii]|nr:hypothetical protein OF83DRAFT_1084959 [Amylostereum chailletii]
MPPRTTVTAMPLSPVGNNTTSIPSIQIQLDTVTPTNNITHTRPPPPIRCVTSQGSFVSLLPVPVAIGRPQPARSTTARPPPAFVSNSGKSDTDVSGSPLAQRKRRIHRANVRRVEPIENVLLAAAATVSGLETGVPAHKTREDKGKKRSAHPRIDAAIDAVLNSTRSWKIEPDDGDARVPLYSGRANVLVGRVGALQSILSPEDGRQQIGEQSGIMFWARDMLEHAWSIRQTVLGMPPAKKTTGKDQTWWPREVPYLIIHSGGLSGESRMGSIFKEDLCNLSWTEHANRAVEMVLTRREPDASHRRMSLRVAVESSEWDPDGKPLNAQSLGFWWLSAVDVVHCVEDRKMVKGVLEAFNFENGAGDLSN